MKLFGGSGGHSGKKNRAKSKAGQYEDPIDYAQPQDMQTAPKPVGKKGKKQKKPLTRRQKRKRIIITTAVVLALVMAAAAAAWIFVRPPEIAQNDPTIKDAENGDKIDMNSLLNSGTRISDVFTFVVGAVDEDETRTDALMVATMDTKKKTINVMNIPRDTMCNNSLSGASRKINAAYGINTGGKGGNIERTKQEIERLMGFQPDKYVIVNFDGIAAIVEAIGGVEYEVPFRMQYDDPSQNLHIDLQAGLQKLNGKQTVEFLRWRHNNDYSMQYANGDEGRVENQQKFLKALAKQVLQPKNALKIRSIADAVFKNVKTDLTAGELIWMGMQAIQIDNDNLKFFTLPGYGAMSYAGSDPYQYSFFFPYQKETLALINEYFNPYQEPITTLDMVSGPQSGGSSSGGGRGWASEDEERDVWGDTSSSNSSTEEPSYDGGDSTGGDTSYDPEAGGEIGGGETGGGETGGSSGGGETGGGESTGGETGGASGGETGGGESTGGESGGSSGGESGGEVVEDPEA